MCPTTHKETQKNQTLDKKAASLGLPFFIEGGRGNPDVVHVLKPDESEFPVTVAAISSMSDYVFDTS